MSLQSGSQNERLGLIEVGSNGVVDLEVDSVGPDPLLDPRYRELVSQLRADPGKPQTDVRLIQDIEKLGENLGAGCIDVVDRFQIEQDRHDRWVICGDGGQELVPQYPSVGEEDCGIEAIKEQALVGLSVWMICDVSIRMICDVSIRIGPRDATQHRGFRRCRLQHDQEQRQTCRDQDADPASRE